MTAHVTSISVVPVTVYLTTPVPSTVPSSLPSLSETAQAVIAHVTSTLTPVTSTSKKDQGILTVNPVTPSGFITITETQTETKTVTDRITETVTVTVTRD